MTSSTMTPGTGQQPTQPRRCCRKHEAEDLNGRIFGRLFIVCPTCQDKRCAHAEDCANACTGQQPAKPGSGEVRTTNEDAANIGHALLEALRTAHPTYCWNDCPSEVVADLLNAVHDARAELTAAQQRIAELERDLENERARGIHTCHDQCPRPLCVAQRRIAELRGCLAELTALVNGESPALLNEDSGGDGELAVRIDNALEDPT